MEEASCFWYGVDNSRQPIISLEMEACTEHGKAADPTLCEQPGVSGFSFTLMYVYIDIYQTEV